MKLGIFGTKGFTDRNAVTHFLDILPPGIDYVLGAEQTGVERWVEESLILRGIKPELHHLPRYATDKEEFARRLQFRTDLIIRRSDVVVLFWDSALIFAPRALMSAQQLHTPNFVITDWLADLQAGTIAAIIQDRLYASLKEIAHV